MRAILLIGNDNAVFLGGLKRLVTGAWVTDATVTCTLLNAVGEVVSGAEDLTMDYLDPDDIDAELLGELGEDGNYMAILEDGLTLTHLAHYTAHIHADAGSDLIGDWELPVTARKRT